MSSALVKGWAPDSVKPPSISHRSYGHRRQLSTLKGNSSTVLTDADDAETLMAQDCCSGVRVPVRKLVASIDSLVWFETKFPPKVHNQLLIPISRAGYLILQFPVPWRSDRALTPVGATMSHPESFQSVERHNVK